MCLRMKTPRTEKPLLAHRVTAFSVRWTVALIALRALLLAAEGLVQPWSGGIDTAGIASAVLNLVQNHALW